jgi:sulfotransferase
MNKTYHFLAGLPRSGNTLISAILNQNPYIYSSPLSPLPTLMWDYVNSANNLEHISRNEENRNRSKQLLNSLFDNFYSDVDKPVVIDREKSWGTPANLDLIKEYVTPNPKIIFTVRDILEIISSYLLLNKKTNYLTQDSVNSSMFVGNYYSDNDTLSEYIMSQDGDVHKSLLSLASAFYPENTGIFHIVEYNDLILKPEETMSGIYKFLEIPQYKHDFQNIEKLESDNDLVLGLPINLHDIRKSISKSSTSTDILSDYIKHKYSNMEFWREGSLLKVRGKDF